MRGNDGDGAAGLAWISSGTRRQRVPSVNYRVELIAVPDLSAESVAWQERQARAAGAIDCRTGKKRVGRNTGAECVDGSDGKAMRKLGIAIERQALTLVSEGVSLLLAKA